VIKVPVKETVRFAYDFTFGQLGTIIGLIWVPMVLIAVLSFLPYALGDTALSPEQNPAAAGAASLRGMAFWLLSMLLYACINVAVVKQALGIRTGNAVIHFSLGTPEFRLWGASLIFLAIIFVLMVGVVLAIIAIGAAAAGFENKFASAAAVTILSIGGLCLILVAMLRLGFLLVPITVAEERISFERGWILTKGNFWRIAAIVFFVTLPTFAVVFGAFLILMGPEIMNLVRQAQHISQDALAERMNAIMESHIAMILGVNLIVAPFSVGLMLGASASAYKGLTAGADAPQS
jgi:hypothetical protein